MGDVDAALPASEAPPEDAGARVAREGREVGGGRGHAVAVLHVAPKLQRVGELAIAFVGRVGRADATPVNAGPHSPRMEGVGAAGCREAVVHLGGHVKSVLHQIELELEFIGK